MNMTEGLSCRLEAPTRAAGWGNLVDVTTLAVALISVGGTLGGTVGGAVLSQRASRADAVEQNQRADREWEQKRMNKRCKPSVISTPI
ncbi:hypothetical protein RPQ02_39380 [Streptomyces sp. AM2-3-1]|uniref:hypothetical protein n=1 Tax=Streptomyces sp. AM2-3-1 TaxID=3075824 RepID=UPI0028C3FF11|nr:hypothetical protein [Streptomyces sp. AM2-3-1]WNO69410.1 hypothetical protein RPQ02_39380 [Streptomyces sp. AM2-3-1]